MSKNVDSSERTAVLSGRAVFADHSRRQELLRLGKIISVNPLDNSELVIIRKGQINTTVDELANYITQAADSVRRRETVPDPPTIIYAIPSDSTVSIIFIAGYNGGNAIINYEFSIDGITYIPFDPVQLVAPIIITGLTNGVPYTIYLKAINLLGKSEKSNPITVTPYPPADPPTGLIASVGDSTITISFIPPANTFGFPITNYQYSINNGTTYIVVSPPQTTSPIIITGLENGKEYTIFIEAITVGPGATSDPITATPYPPPGAPTDLVALGDDTFITLSFIPGSNYGTPITNYQYTLNGGAFIDSGKLSSLITISSLTNGTPYSIYLQAINIAGPGPSSVTVTATPYPHPDPPTALSTNVSDSAISIYFTDGNNFGFPITNYQYSINSSNYIAFDPAQTTQPIIIGSLTNGTPYTIRLETITIGPGPASDPITAIPCRVPDPPTIISTLDGNSTITIDFTPGSNYGGVITDYLYSIDNTNYTPLGQTSNPLVISSLTNGTVYTITLEAINAAGRGAASDPITGRPYTFPDAPAILSHTLNPFSYQAYSVTIDFIPGFDNGRSITNYQYSIDAGSNYSTFNPVQITSPITISSLGPGASYDIYLQAINLAGAGPASELVSINCPAVPPEPPSGITASPSDSTLTLDFTPGFNGGTAIVNYQYSYSTDGGTTYGAYTEFRPAQATPPLTLSGLTNGTVYTILLQAINAIGPSDPSAPITATPYPQPDPPTDLTAQVNDSTIRIYFTAGATYGYPITNYKYSTDYGSNYTAFNPAQIASPVTIAQLANGTPYTINLQAVTIGPGPSSLSITATPYPPPDAPTNLSAVGNDSTITISFTPGSDRGSVITDYQYSTDNTNYTVLGQSNSPVTISSLINGTPYTIYLEAINVAGPGPASDPITATPYPHPDPPADLTAIVNDSTITINFTDGNTFGFPITNYQYSINSSNYVELSPAQTAPPITFSSLTNGTPYTINLQTITIGPGPSSVSITATPYPPPDAPTNLSALGDNSTIIIYFTAGFDYGSAITNYQYSINSGSNYTAFSPAQAVSPVRISSLTNGDIYTVQLQAINVAGPGPASASITATPYPHPDAPTNLSATVYDSTITINFTDGNTYGFSITNYQYSINRGATYTELTPAKTDPPITITNLTNGIPYTIYLEAITIGPGAASEPITATPYPPPDPPTNLSAVGSDSTITISFTPGSDKGSAITNYQYSIDRGSNYTAFNPANAISPISISSLANNSPYTVYLEAINIAGPGPASAPVTATPFRSPAAPTNLSAVVSDSTITVNFTDGNTYGAAITNYQYSINGSNYTVVDPAQTAPPITISSLTNGTPYRIRIETITYGPGLPSDAITATPYKAPDAPTNLSAVGGNSTITISFTAGYDNGSAITNYQYSIDSGSNYTVFNPVQPVSPVTISSLTNGDIYTVQLQAINVAGAGPASASVTATPYNPPDPPTGLLAVASDSTITVYFTDGETYGFSITNYQYSIDNSNYTAFNPPDTASPITISSLANGTAYTINIQTITVGPGPPSDPITETPYKTPDAPTNLSAVGTDSTITIRFTAGFNGGRTITDYKYSIDATTYITSGQLSSPISISSLTNGTPYTIYLQAVNLAGSSPPSDPVTAIPDKFNGPYAPTNLSAVDGNSIITVSFTDGSDNGSPITDYKYSIDNGISYTSLGKSSSPVVISNLTNGTLYTIILQAINAIGLGRPSEPITGTPYTYADPPTITSHTLNPYSNGKYSVNIEFTPGSDNGRPITDYEYSINGGTNYALLGEIKSPITLFNLDPGTTYNIYLKAVNLAGTGTRSSPVVSVNTPAAPSVAPEPPTNLSAITNNSTITINFTPGYDGGAAITNYQYSLNNGSNYTAFNPAQPAPPVTIGNLVNFTPYTIYLQTINSVSASIASEPITATPYPFADPPTALSSSVNDSTIIIDFTRGNTYGYSITNYQYSFDGSTYTEFSPAQTVSPITISGLTNGTRYTIYIQPITFAAGTASAPITATPYPPPDPPTNLSAVERNSRITINFTPGYDGGAGITNYQYSLNNGSNYTVFNPAQAAPPVTIRNLVNFTSYTIYLKAINLVSTSLVSEPITATPYPYADPPTDLLVTEYNNRVMIAFTPGYTYGFSIINYQYSFDGLNYTGYSSAQTTSPITISRLTNGTRYTIYIRAITFAPGIASDPITAIPRGPPSPPTNLSAITNNSTITINFTPGYDGGEAITNYQYSLNNGSNYTVFDPAQATPPVTISNLVNFSSYKIYLKAINFVSTSVSSRLLRATPYPFADPPTGLSVTESENTVMIYFTPGYTYGYSIINYQYSFDSLNYTAFSPAQTASPITISGLTNGTIYSIYIQPITFAAGRASDPITAIPLGPPYPPTGLSMVSGNSRITINFTPGYDGGAAIRNYQYSLNNGSNYTVFNPPEAAPPVTIRNLVNYSSYKIYLKAINLVSTSLVSESIIATPYPYAEPPTGLSVTESENTVMIYFTPGYTYGFSIINYQYSFNGSTYTEFSPAQTVSPITISGLTNGTTYTIYIQPITFAPGIASDPITAIPRGPPSPPTNLSAVAGYSLINIHFTPGSDGGVAITNYQYSIDSRNYFPFIPAQTRSPITFSDLLNYNSYTIYLKAINSLSTSLVSEPITATPYPLAGQPTGLSNIVSDSSVFINFTPGSIYGYPITNYQYSFDAYNYTAFDPPETVSPIRITGLENYTTYNIYIQPITVGPGTASDPITVIPRPFPYQPPEPPINLSATVADSRITINFTDGFTYAFPITNYQYSFDNRNYIELSNITTAPPIIIYGLTNASTYTIYVKAITLGPGRPSAPITATPYPLPDAPRGLLSMVSDSTVFIEFIPGSIYPSTITNYQYSFDSYNYTAFSPSQTSTPFIFAGLTNGTEYTINLQAINPAGPGAASDPITASIPILPPNPPTDISAIVNDSTITLNFTPGYYSGDPITDYLYSINGGAYISLDQSDPPIIISSLTNGTPYTIYLKAVNSISTSLRSAPITATPYPPPDPPTGLLTRVSAATIFIDFIPGYDNGSAITNYRYYLKYLYAFDESRVSTSPITISYLWDWLGDTFNVYLQAMNIAGYGRISEPVTTILPALAPDPPRNLSAKPLNSGIRLYFNPGSYNGSPIIDYLYSINGSTYISSGESTIPGQYGANFIINNLTNGISYTISLKAVNSISTSVASESVTIIPCPPADTATVLSGVGADSSAIIYFIPGNVNGPYPITNYAYCLDTVNFIPFDPPQIASPLIISGLTNDSYYIIYIAPITFSLGNIDAWKCRADVTPTANPPPRPIPNPPTNLSAVVSNSTITLYFTPGSDNGNAITNYLYSIDGGNTYISSGRLTSPIIITNLTNGIPYTIYLQAFNTGGPSTASAPITATPYPLPDPPRLLPTIASSTITLNFTNGNTYGYSITNYEYSINRSNYIAFSPPKTAPPITFSSLINGTPYTIKLKTVTVVTGPASAPITTTPYSLPGAITNLSAIGSNSAIIVSFTNYESGIMNYQYSTDGSNYTAVNPIQRTSPVTINNLTNGTLYTIYLKAINAAGSGPASAPITATPYSFPLAPTIDYITPGDSMLTVFFSQVNNGTTIINYQYSIDGYSYIILNQTISPFIINNLTNGTLYTIYLKAINPLSPGPASAPVTATPYIKSHAPTGLSITALGYSMITIGFTDGDTYGYPITNYQYSFDSSNYIPLANVTIAPPITIDGLTNGSTYTIYLKAVTIGPGLASAPITATACATPNAPTNLSAIGSNSAAIITFTPGFNGGSAITNYQYSIDSGSNYTVFDPLQTSSPITIGNLTNATPYNIFLKAINRAGPGAASASVTVTPYPLPDAPTSLSTTALGYSTITIGFTDGNTYGYSITNYQYSFNGTSYNTVSTFTADPPSIKLDGLKNASTYTIYLQAITIGPGVASDPITATACATPNAPTNLSAIGSNSAAIITFTPGFNGGSAITNYQYSIDSGSNYTVFDPLQTSSPIIIGNLIDATPYTIYLKAINPAGPGTASDPIMVTPYPLPDAPTGLSPTALGYSTITIGFIDGNTYGYAITNYQYSFNGNTYNTVNSFTEGPPSITLDGLKNASTYTIYLKAVTIGPGVASDPISATPYIAPDAPTNLSAVGSNSAVIISFTSGFNGGSAITNYQYSIDSGTTYTMFDPVKISSPITIDNLTNATPYTIYLQAINAAGTGLASDPLTATPYGRPFAPTIDYITPSDSTLTTYFTPGYDNGSTITGYKYSIDGSNYTISDQSISPVIITGLTNGTLYSVTIQAINAAGAGTASTGVTETPYGVPLAPTINSITPGDTELIIDFTAGSDNGNAITDYLYSTDGSNYTAMGQTTSPFTITGLENDTEYSVTIKASNAAGAGAASSAMSATPVAA